MTSYEVEISQSAEKRLRKLPRPDRERVSSAMLALAADPFPRGARKLSGYDDVYRVRAGRYRILYSVSDTALTVVVLKVGHRRNVHR